jgi:hypothetical protein
MASPKQVAMVRAIFSKAGIQHEVDQFDWLYENGINVDHLNEMTDAEVNIVVEELGE